MCSKYLPVSVYSQCIQVPVKNTVVLQSCCLSFGKYYAFVGKIFPALLDWCSCKTCTLHSSYKSCCKMFCTFKSLCKCSDCGAEWVTLRSALFTGGGLLLGWDCKNLLPSTAGRRPTKRVVEEDNYPAARRREKRVRGRRKKDCTEGGVCRFVSILGHGVCQGSAAVFLMTLIREDSGAAVRLHTVLRAYRRRDPSPNGERRYSLSPEAAGSKVPLLVWTCPLHCVTKILSFGAQHLTVPFKCLARLWPLICIC